MEDESLFSNPWAQDTAEASDMSNIFRSVKWFAGWLTFEYLPTMLLHSH